MLVLSLDSYHTLGILAQAAGDYDEAARQYQRALDTFERLGDQAGMARGYSQLGVRNRHVTAPLRPRSAGTCGRC